MQEQTRLTYYDPNSVARPQNGADCFVEQHPNQPGTVTMGAPPFITEVRNCNVLICWALTGGLTPKERASLLDFVSSAMPLINHRGSVATKALSTFDLAVPTRETAVWACMSSVVGLSNFVFTSWQPFVL